jgi:hypothetical protein
VSVSSGCGRRDSSLRNRSRPLARSDSTKRSRRAVDGEGPAGEGSGDRHRPADARAHSAESAAHVHRTLGGNSWRRGRGRGGRRPGRRPRRRGRLEPGASSVVARPGTRRESSAAGHRRRQGGRVSRGRRRRRPNRRRSSRGRSTHRRDRPARCVWPGGSGRRSRGRGRRHDHRRRRCRLERRRRLRGWLCRNGRRHRLGLRRRRRVCLRRGLRRRLGRGSRRGGRLRRGRRLGRWRRLGRRRRAARRQKPERVDVALRVGGHARAEIDVGLAVLGVARVRRRADDRLLADRLPARHRDRAEVLEGHGVAVGSEDRDRAAPARDRAREEHRAHRRRPNRTARDRSDVDPAMLPGRVGVARREREGAQDGAVHRPAPGHGSRRDDEGDERQGDDEEAFQ